jgi:hypothetical protein
LLHEIYCEEERQSDRARLKGIRIKILNFQCQMIEIGASYDESVNDDALVLPCILI